MTTKPMTGQQETHLMEVQSYIARWVEHKYRKGAAEHGGSLMDMPNGDLLDNVIDELVDGVVYALTLRLKYIDHREGLKSPQVPNALFDKEDNQTLLAVDAEMRRSLKEKGPLTMDPAVAMLILGEEFGEVNRAILEARKAARGGCPRVAEDHLNSAMVELVQLISVSVFMIRNLRRAHAIVCSWAAEKSREIVIQKEQGK